MSRAVSPPTDPTDLQLAQLARLAEIGMEIAEAAGRQARGEGEGAGADPALSFSRAARAVRLTIALQARLVADRAVAERAQGAARAAEAARRRSRIHDKVEALIERAVETEDAEADATEHLSSAAWERLTETDDAELLDLPVEELVARICADLDLPAGWAGDAFGAAGRGCSAGHGPLSHPAGDSSPVSGGAAQGVGAVLLPCPEEDGGGGPQGRRGRAARAAPPRPWRMSG